MNINLEQYIGRCDCGKEHGLLTKKIIIEAGAKNQLAEVAGYLGLNNQGVIICDTNTRPFAQDCAKVLDGYLREECNILVLDANGLHADEKAVVILEKDLPKDTGWLLAAGSGTIHDITRYAAHERGINFIAFPTAATVDGFVSAVSAMTWYGFKKTLPGIAPLAVVADTDIFAAAPYRLTAAGIGDVLGKYTSLVDWEISHLVTGEAFCPSIAAITREAADRVRANLTAIRSGNPENLENLMFALILSGIGMQMWGNSRPASGAEHHLSHLWEMDCLNSHIDALHGEKVGVGLLLVLAEYHRIAASERIGLYSPYGGIPHDLLREKMGGLYGDIAKENNPDPLTNIDRSKLEAVLPEMRGLLSGLPNPVEMTMEMEAAGCCTTLCEIRLSNDILSDSLRISPFVRNRLTVMRLRQILDESPR